MILLLALLALPILGVMAALAVPLIGGLAVLAAPFIAGLAILALPALAIAALADAFSTANISAPVLTTLEVLGIVVAAVVLIAALVYIADRLAARARLPAPRSQEVPVGAREQVIMQPQRQVAVSIVQQSIPADLAGQCQDLQAVPCPV